MDYKNVEGLSEDNVLELYNDILEYKDLSAAGCIWRLDCDNGQKFNVCWGNCGSLPVGTKHYCYSYRCGTYYTYRYCGGAGSGYETIIKYDSACDGQYFLRVYSV